MDFNNPSVFAAWMLICTVFVVGAFFFMFKRAYPSVGRTLIDSMRKGGYSKETALKALRGAMLPAAVKQSLVRYAETVYSDNNGGNT